MAKRVLEGFWGAQGRRERDSAVHRSALTRRLVALECHASAQRNAVDERSRALINRNAVVVVCGPDITGTHHGTMSTLPTGAKTSRPPEAPRRTAVHCRSS